MALTNIWVLSLWLDSLVNFHSLAFLDIWKCYLFRFIVRKNWSNKWPIEESSSKWTLVQQMAKPSVRKRITAFQKFVFHIFSSASSGATKSPQTLCSSRICLFLILARSHNSAPTPSPGFLIVPQGDPLRILDQVSSHLDMFLL